MSDHFKNFDELFPRRAGFVPPAAFGSRAAGLPAVRHSRRGSARHIRPSRARYNPEGQHSAHPAQPRPVQPEGQRPARPAQPRPVQPEGQALRASGPTHRCARRGRPARPHPVQPHAQPPGPGADAARRQSAAAAAGLTPIRSRRLPRPQPTSRPAPEGGTGSACRALRARLSRKRRAAPAAAAVLAA